MALYSIICSPLSNTTETLKDVQKTRKTKKEKEVRKRWEPGESQGWQQKDMPGERRVRLENNPVSKRKQERRYGVHLCHPSTPESKAGGLLRVRIEASMGYIERPCLKQKK